MRPHVERECSAHIVDGRMVCGCLTDKPELRADLSVCYPKMTKLLAELNPQAAAEGRLPK